MERIYLVIAILTVAIFHSGRTEASEWGCEVLLCAASSNPSWHGVAECHPPMEKLISAMKRPGFSWPTCPEGGTGKPGFEQYANCPAGWTPAAADENFGRSNRGELSRCTRKISTCKGVQSSSGNRNGEHTTVTKDGITRVYRSWSSCQHQEFKARPRREEPYFFDINDQTTGRSTRYYFDLHD